LESPEQSSAAREHPHDRLCRIPRVLLSPWRPGNPLGGCAVALARQGLQKVRRELQRSRTHTRAPTHCIQGAGADGGTLSLQSHLARLLAVGLGDEPALRNSFLLAPNPSFWRVGLPVPGAGVVVAGCAVATA